MGGTRALQMTPIVVDGVMYVAAVNEARALDARTGRQIWQFVRPQTPGLVPTGDPAAGINRGVAVLGHRVFLQTDHAHLLALDRLTGRLQWDVEMADYRLNYGSTGAPLIVNDLVIAGMSAGDEGVRGFLDAYRASTGERVWRFWTVPARGEPGSETWIGKALEHGCAATWLTGSYDPRRSSCIGRPAIRAPITTATNARGTTCTPRRSSRSIRRQASCDGIFNSPHTIFTTGMQISRRCSLMPNFAAATETARRRESERVLLRARSAHRPDADGGTVRETPDLVVRHRRRRPPATAGHVRDSVEGTRTCPAVAGAANWPSTAFNPARVVLCDGFRRCAVYRKNSNWFELGKSFYGGTTRTAPIEGGGKSLRALDLQSGKMVGGSTRGRRRERLGVMSTAGGLVFYGDNTGEP